MELVTRTPFEGGPATHIGTGAHGSPRIKVNPAAITPFRAKIADWLSLVSVPGLEGAALYYIGQDVIARGWEFSPSVEWGAALAAPLAAYPVIRYGLYVMLRRRVACVFTPDRFSYRSVWGWKHFDRELPHKFSLADHRKAAREKQDIEFHEPNRKRRWWSRAAKLYYGEAFHLHFEYADQRHVIMTIYGRERAHRILSRLTLCDETMDAQARDGTGTALKAEEEWSPQAGTLPDLA